MPNSMRCSRNCLALLAQQQQLWASLKAGVPPASHLYATANQVASTSEAYSSPQRHSAPPTYRLVSPAGHSTGAAQLELAAATTGTGMIRHNIFITQILLQ